VKLNRIPERSLMSGWIAAVIWACLLVVQISPAALANVAVPLADDPVVERRLIVISEELRCLVCQNESLAGSRADLALDLRREIRTLIKGGKTDAEILDFMVSRYGDFVLYRPPVKPITWALWFGPFLLLIGAVVVLVRMVRKGQRNEVTPVLDAAQRARAQALLKDSERPS
jgi:cytochrome c-type biogenesis protein CcmH